jgi:hypothetical protein
MIAASAAARRTRMRPPQDHELIHQVQHEFDQLSTLAWTTPSAGWDGFGGRRPHRYEGKLDNLEAASYLTS